MALIILDVSKSEFPNDENRVYPIRKGRVKLLNGDNEVDDSLIPYLQENPSFMNAVKTGVVTLPSSLPLSKPAIDSLELEET